MILVNGDSVTFGSGLLEEEISWPSLIFDCNNIAEPGSSNPSIYRRTLEEIYLNSYDVVIVAWSSFYRYEFADNYGKAKTFLLSNYKNKNSSASIILKELLNNWHNDFWYFKQFLLILSNLKLHCEHLGINFYCLNTDRDVAKYYSTFCNNYLDFYKTFNLDLYTDEEIKKEFNFLSTLICETSNCWIISPTVSITEIYGNNTVSTTDRHPNQQGHQLIASKLSPLFKLKLG